MLFSDKHEPGSNNRVSCMVLNDVDRRDRSQGKGRPVGPILEESGRGAWGGKRNERGRLETERVEGEKQQRTS